MARGKKTLKNAPLLVRSLTVTPELETLLHTLGQEASDTLGWTVSMSAVVRAVLRYIEQQPSVWRREHLFPLIEKEITAGTVWGSKKK